MNRRLSWTFLLVCLLACSSAPEPGQTPGQEEPSADDSAGGELGCQEGGDRFAPPLEQQASDIRGTLLEVSPDGEAVGNHEWLLHLEESDGTPIEEAELSVYPSMPQHGHGTPIEPSVSELGGGDYSVTTINLFMPGTWEVEIEVESYELPLVFVGCVE